MDLGDKALAAREAYEASLLAAACAKVRAFAAQARFFAAQAAEKAEAEQADAEKPAEKVG